MFSLYLSHVADFEEERGDRTEEAYQDVLKAVASLLKLFKLDRRNLE